MDTIKAMRATLDEAALRDHDMISFETANVDQEHLESMYVRMVNSDPPMSEAKLGRWLGYAQGVLVAHDTLTLDEVKAINERFSNDWTHLHKVRGTKYKVIGQARAQCSVEPIKDGDMLTLYRGEDGVYSVRPPSEFNDGRFERIVHNAIPASDRME